MQLRRTVMMGGLWASLVFGGCGLFHESRTQQTWTLNTSPRVPAATGKVSVKPGDDGNQTLKLDVERLAAPPRVFDGANTYVVWLIVPGNAPENIGVLPLDDKLNGHLQTKTPFRTFDVLVTAEPSPTATRPNENNRVMSASVRLPS
ncbi:MAG TPA: hypothetical protein VHO67_06790 [Polyangia bacterium]|nr:hypothetical protein [Polyangia bacterium]